MCLFRKYIPQRLVNWSWQFSFSNVVSYICNYNIAMLFHPVCPCFFFLNSSENTVKGDERITRAVGLSKKLVGHFSHTWKGKMALKKAQKEYNLPEHSLITECPTRWGSRQNDSESSRAAAGHKRRPVSRQKVKTFSSFLAGPRCTWVHKPGIAASARIYRCSIRWKIRKCFICETCTSLDEHLNSCCKGRRQWFNSPFKSP